PTLHFWTRATWWNGSSGLSAGEITAGHHCCSSGKKGDGRNARSWQPQAKVLRSGRDEFLDHLRPAAWAGARKPASGRRNPAFTSPVEQHVRVYSGPGSAARSGFQDPEG